MKRNVYIWIVMIALMFCGCASDVSKVGMHPSWDKNNDGINDCEDDGTCDDSWDYTKPRTD